MSFSRLTMLVVLVAMLVCAGCTGMADDPEGTDGGAVRDGGRAADGGGVDAGTPTDGGTTDGATIEDAAVDGGSTDPCADALLCETFDTYTETDLTDGQRFGPWRAALRTPGGAMNLDGTHTVSGAHALHVSIDMDATAGGRLFTDGAQPVVEGNPTHLYGRMMMYLEPNGSSVHWTFFGASGDAEPSSPETGRRATYLISSLPRSDVNTYSFVDGLEATSSDPFHDCWFQSMEPMPSGRWTCVAFEMDSVARRLRLTTDGAAAPVVSVDDHGQGCVGDVVPDDAPWYGPAIDQLYVGAWSFHPMTGPLEVWIDDVIVDSAPVPCPTP